MATLISDEEMRERAAKHARRRLSDLVFSVAIMLVGAVGYAIAVLMGN